MVYSTVYELCTQCKLPMNCALQIGWWCVLFINYCGRGYINRYGQQAAAEVGGKMVLGLYATPIFNPFFFAFRFPDDALYCSEGVWRLLTIGGGPLGFGECTHNTTVTFPMVLDVPYVMGAALLVWGEKEGKGCGKSTLMCNSAGVGTGASKCEPWLLFLPPYSPSLLILVTDECGIVAQVSTPLAQAEISTYYISTFYTDHTLVRAPLCG